MKTNNEWKGYDLEQLRYRRLVNEVKRDVQRQKIGMQINALRGNGGRFSAISLSHKVLSVLSYMDYITIGIKIIKLLRSLRKRR